MEFTLDTDAHTVTLSADDFAALLINREIASGPTWRLGPSQPAFREPEKPVVVELRRFWVPSVGQGRNHAEYLVMAAVYSDGRVEYTCSCPDFRWRGIKDGRATNHQCKHIVSVMFHPEQYRVA